MGLQCILRFIPFLMVCEIYVCRTHILSLLGLADINELWLERGATDKESIDVLGLSY